MNSKSQMRSEALQPRSEPRRLVVLGATGSIGRSVADVVEGAPGMFRVEAVASGGNPEALARMAIRLGARFAALADADGYTALRDALGGSGVRAGAGPSAVVEAALYPCDLVVGAIAGAAGVAPTYAALEAGATIALANKECLVCAGGPFMKTAQRVGATVLPMDSEHNAIFQAMGGHPVSSLEKMILTASGGPFRTWTAEAIAAATPKQALAHPNWSMGPKVTIDSATLMNKGLELIEAYHIFAIPAEKLGVLVHPQSIVHGLVSFADGSVTAGMACPDMKAPIAHCLAFPHRAPTAVKRLDLAELGSLTFERPDFVRFPALRLALDMLAEGGALPTVLNAGNEIAVHAFLEGSIGFDQIVPTVQAICDWAAKEGMAGEPATVADALAVDHISRERTRAVLAEGGRGRMLKK